MKPALNQLMCDCMMSMNSRQHRNMGDLQPPKSQTKSLYSDRHNACRLTIRSAFSPLFYLTSHAISPVRKMIAL